jgi:peptide/nickel transport system ATP-binding protein
MQNVTNKNLLAIKNLQVQYFSEGNIVHAVNGISLEMRMGKTLGLVGETGAGKTSTAKAIMRILPEVSAKIVDGEIAFAGQELLSLTERQMRKIRGQKISMIFQDPMTALNPIARVGDQISEVIKLHNDISKLEAKERAMQMLEKVGISRDRYHEYPHQFSGGMKQRVVIAIALACGPELLIADEPTTALDVTIQAQVLEMINSLKDSFATSMLLITHDLGVVGKVCDDVAIMYAGQIIEMGSKEVIFDNPVHPYTTGLFEAVPRIEDDLDRLHPITGMPPDPTNLPQGCYFSPRCKYAIDECKAGKPELTEISPGHFCRCILASRGAL